MADAITSESRDGKGAGDRDEPYVWGRPREYLSVVQQGWLTILRGECMDTRRGGEKRNRATGDLAYTNTLDNGLIVPARTTP
jgi:hypothetical protein